MNRLAYPLSLSHLKKILAKEISLENISRDQIFRFTSVGFIEKVSQVQLELFDGTETAAFDLDQSAPALEIKEVVRVHYLISKSLQVRVIFIDKVQHGEQILVHLIEQLKVSQGQQSAVGGQQGDFNNFFDGVGGIQ